MARIGYLYLRGGVWDGEVILPQEFVQAVGRPSPHALELPVIGGSNPPDTARRYGMAWFTNNDGAMPEVPPDAYWAWGLLDSLIVVIPSLDIVMARAGNGMGRTGWNADYAYIAPFITPIARSATAGGAVALVPDVTGISQGAAENELRAANLQVGHISRIPDQFMAADHVISQDPGPGIEVVAGSPVALVVSLGVDPVEIPVVVGLSEVAANATLAGAGFLVGNITWTSHASVPDGHVIDQQPSAGTLAAFGSTVGLIVSSGPSVSAAWLQFDGVNDVVTIPSSAALKVSGALSIEARIPAAHDFRQQNAGSRPSEGSGLRAHGVDEYRRLYRRHARQLAVQRHAWQCDTQSLWRLADAQCLATRRGNL